MCMCYVCVSLGSRTGIVDVLKEVAKIMTRKPQANLRRYTVPHQHPRDRCIPFSTEVWRSWARQAFDDSKEAQTRDLGRKPSHRLTD